MIMFFCLMASVAGARGCMNQVKPLEPKEMEDQKEKVDTMLFALYDGWPGFSYMDQETGKPTGMAREMVERACDACQDQVKCDTVYIGAYQGRCFDPVQLTGEGLMDEHFHACVGWAPSVMRKNVFNFSAPLMNLFKGAIYTRPDMDLTDTQALMTMSVGVRRYLYIDERCIRNNLPVGDPLLGANVKVVEADDWAQMRQQFDDGEFDFVLMPADNSATDGLMLVREAMECAEGGFSLMHRKDIDIGWFSGCLAKGLKSPVDDPLGPHGEYHRMCQRWGMSDLCYTDEQMNMMGDMDTTMPMDGTSDWNPKMTRR